MGLRFGVQVDYSLGMRIKQEGALRVCAKEGRSGWFVILQGTTTVLAFDKILT